MDTCWKCGNPVERQAGPAKPSIWRDEAGSMHCRPLSINDPVPPLHAPATDPDGQR